MSNVLILGGYGNFGKRIARMLVRHGVNVIVAGRDLAKADALVRELPGNFASAAAFDVKVALSSQLETLRPSIVVNTCGPFQRSDYGIARTCIRHSVNYIDLADGRDFVNNISELDGEAKRAGVAVVSGASTVPGLSSAAVEHFLREFSEIHSLKFGIAPGQKAERGLATTQAILGYVGKRLAPCAGHERRFGWQDLHIQNYPVIGRRLMSNCDVPDLDLLPDRYGIESIRFSAGMENPIVHMGIWTLSWLVRLGLPIRLEDYSATLLRASNRFDFLGSADGGMHIVIEGRDVAGKALCKTWFIVALGGDGPYIPTVPAVILAKKLVSGDLDLKGAMPCVGLVSLHEYLQELGHLRVSTYESSSTSKDMTDH